MTTTPNSATAGTTRYQDQLSVECRKRNWRDPSWQIYSDRRGGRTAWSAAVTVEGQSIAARLWYDGQYINSAKEEAAELAVNTMCKPASGVASRHQQESKSTHVSSGRQQVAQRW